MKIVNSIYNIYNERFKELEKLKKEVDNTITSFKKNSWHYFSRIKELESFALKLETGRCNKPSELEDFFACTIVVENLSEIKNAVNRIAEKFDIKSQRPKNNYVTHKDAHSFQFDDLRLYVTIKQFEYMPENILSEIVFEIQIKTFLQHAWGIATHDLIYKSNTINWGKQRVAYQIKAMLEQAELTISGADGLSKLDEISKSNELTDKLNSIIIFLVDNFPHEFLPKDLIRLAANIDNILIFFKIDLVLLKKILDAETNKNRGVSTLNLSPYSVILQSIINQEQTIFESGFKTNNNKKVKGFFIPREIDLTKLNLVESSKIIST